MSLVESIMSTMIAGAVALIVNARVTGSWGGGVSLTGSLIISSLVIKYVVRRSFAGLEDGLLLLRARRRLRYWIGS
jgi:hypothetical protein